MATAAAAGLALGSPAMSEDILAIADVPANGDVEEKQDELQGATEVEEEKQDEGGGDMDFEVDNSFDYMEEVVYDRPVDAVEVPSAGGEVQNESKNAVSEAQAPDATAGDDAVVIAPFTLITQAQSTLDLDKGDRTVIEAPPAAHSTPPAPAEDEAASHTGAQDDGKEDETAVMKSVSVAVKEIAAVEIEASGGQEATSMEASPSTHEAHGKGDETEFDEEQMTKRPLTEGGQATGASDQLQEEQQAQGEGLSESADPPAAVAYCEDDTQHTLATEPAASVTKYPAPDANSPASVAKPAGLDGTSPASAAKSSVEMAGSPPPKRKHVATKKRPASSALSDSLAFAGQAPTPRRSKRLKIEHDADSPATTGSTALAAASPAAKHLAGEAEMVAHFDRLESVTDGSHSTAPLANMRCKHCHRHLTASRGSAARHLEACPKYAHRNQSNADKLDREEKPRPPPTSVSPVGPALSPSTRSPVAHGTSKRAATLPQVKQEGIEGDGQLAWLVGSEALVGRLKTAFQRAPVVGDAPVSRFQALIDDDVTGLRHLLVADLLDAVNPEDGPTVLLRTHMPSIRRTGADRVDTRRQAKVQDSMDFPLCFPAPRSVAELVVPPLANAFGLGYAMRRHTAKIASCPLPGTVLDWQFHRNDTFIFQLSGKALWKMKKSSVNNPLRCFHPHSRLLEDVEQVVKMHQLATMDKPGLELLAPPFDALHVFDDDEAESDGDGTTGGTTQLQEHMLSPGSMAYVPAGVWFETEAVGERVMWLEVQLAAVAYEELAFSALRQLAWRDEKWRQRLIVHPDNRSHALSTRRHMTELLQDLYHKLDLLEPRDILPEYLVLEDLQELVAGGPTRAATESAALAEVEVDLTSSTFKPKHVKIFKDATYRVNPIAVLLSAEQLSFKSERGDQSRVTTGRSTLKPHCALKKKPKPKRSQTLRVFAHRDEHVYVLHLNFGNDELRSQLRVKFRCSPAQAKMVDWLCCRGDESFNVEELGRGDDAAALPKKGVGRSEETARTMLRFLSCVGYVSQVNAPV